MGNASTTATFGGDAWYYISSTEKQVAFFTPTVLNREILAVYFDKTGKVTGLRHFGLRDGHVDRLRDPRDAGARPRTDFPAAVAERHSPARAARAA